MLSKERNYGVDFLRILSMFMVVVLHVLGKGGILENATQGSAHYWVAWFIEIASYCAVNCFALISGFVMLNSKPKISRITGLWFQTLFYTVSITILFSVIMPETFVLTDFVKAFLPISTAHYWYISAYLGMYILVPVLNAAIENLGKRTLETVFVGVLLAFGALSIRFDPFILRNGYSVIWLCLVYLLGGYIKKYNIASKVKGIKAWGLYFSMIVITFISKYVIETFTSLTAKDEKYGELLVSYESPTILLAGVGLFIGITQLKFPKRIEKAISIFAPASLGVYLIHVSKPVWLNVIEDFSKGFVDKNIVVMVLLTLGSAIVIYLVCSFIEILRQYIFKLLKINKLCLIIEDLANKIFDKFYSKFNEEDCKITK